MCIFLNKLKNEKGAAAVEFAFILIFILIPIVFGIIYFGPVFYDWIALTHAARDSARLLAVETKFDEHGNISNDSGAEYSDDGLITYIKKSIPKYILPLLIQIEIYGSGQEYWGNLENLDITINHIDPDKIGAESSVKVSGDYIINIPLIPALSNKNIHISNEVFMRQEQ